ALVTDLGTLAREDEDEDLTLAAVPAGPEPLDERVARARAACGWDLAVAPTVAELPPPTAEELGALRAWDARGWFLRVR
ncbi:MAG TPA: hypothetical protein VN180_10985, partial [Acidimicrobiia bacterium]|nr:hypothetical protein [Acidimicrobiia bacterium]